MTSFNNIRNTDSVIVFHSYLQACAQAIKAWEVKNEKKAEDSTEIKLCCQIPPISKMDNSLAALKNCERLSLSTNTIDRISSLAGMSNLRILSLGRNNIKKLERLEDVAGTLEQLWISYNQITSLEGLACLKHLKVFYCSNNNIKSFSELDKIVSQQYFPSSHKDSITTNHECLHYSYVIKFSIFWLVIFWI